MTLKIFSDNFKGCAKIDKKPKTKKFVKIKYKRKPKLDKFIQFSHDDDIDRIIDNEINEKELIAKGIIRKITGDYKHTSHPDFEKKTETVFLKGSLNSKNVQTISNNGAPVILKKDDDIKRLSLVEEIYIPKEYISNSKLNSTEFRSRFVDGYFVRLYLAWEYCLNLYKYDFLPKAIDIENNCLTTLFHIDKEKELSDREEDLIMFYPNTIPAEETMSLLLDSNLDIYTFAYTGGSVSPAKISFSKHLEEKYYKKVIIDDDRVKSNLLSIFLNEMKSNSSNISDNYSNTINKLESFVDLYEVEIIVKGDKNYISELGKFLKQKYPNSFGQAGKVINFPKSTGKQTGKPILYNRKMNMRH